MSIKRVVPLLCLTALLAGCGKKGSDSYTAAAPPSAEGLARARAAAEVANAIAANPDGADSILKAAGYTPEGFQQLMFEIAADSTQAATYAAARTK